MNTLHPTTAQFSLIHSTKKLYITISLLAVMLAFVTVPTARANLPPETYYQGIDTGINGDDVGSAALPIGFNFTFFGNIYSEFYVSSNGYISFENRDLTNYTNDDIDDTTEPNNYVAPFWDDLIVDNSSGQHVYYKTIGTAPNRRLVVQYTNVGFWDDPTPLGTFSIILYEGSNNIQFQYRYLTGDSARTNGASATVGLENDNGKRGTKFSFNTESLSSEQVILFTPNRNNYDIGTAPYKGILLGAGATATPDIPLQTAPLHNATTSQTPTFTWEAAANAVSYELRIDNDADMGSLTLNPTDITDTFFTPSVPLPEDTYYWIVIAHNTSDSSWSEQRGFTTSSNPPLPDTPQLTSPAPNETDVSLSPTFTWQAASGADSYQLLVSENSDLSAPLIDQSGFARASYESSGFASDTVYYWSVIASNTTGSSQSATHSFTTLHVNSAPTANDDSSSVDEDSGTTSIDVVTNDTDPDTDDTLSITSVGTPDNSGTAVINNNQIDYTPAPNFFGTETFTYIINDGNGGSDSATVMVEVTAVNDAPTANNDTETVVEDSGTTQLDVLANDQDLDASDILSIVFVSTPDQGGTADINNDQIDYTPAPNFFGSETLTYTISDGNGGSAVATVTIEVTELNDTPTANDDNDSAPEDSGTILIDVLANDLDPDSSDVLSISSVSLPDCGGTAVINNNKIEYTAAPTFAGSETFTYTVSDGRGGTDSALVTMAIYVSSSNAAPHAYDDSQETLEDSSIIIDVLDNDDDPDGDSLAILNISQAAYGTAVIQGNAIKYTPNPNFHGSDSFTYTVGDGEFTDVATANITVVSVNDLPQATQDSATINAGTSIAINVLENDADPVEGSSLFITTVANPAHGTATTNGTAITYTPDSGFVGTETFTYTMSDGTDSVTGTITITVNPYQLFIPLVIK